MLVEKRDSSDVTDGHWDGYLTREPYRRLRPFMLTMGYFVESNRLSRRYVAQLGRKPSINNLEGTPKG